jgi:glutathione S-transferase
MQLVIGDKNTSTWSMRPWLVMRRLGLSFEEVHVRMRQPDTSEQAARYSPSAKVPVLIDGDLKIWDSLAICEYLAETYPDARLWPQDPKVRAVARSVTAEMHSGFPSIRGELSMDLGLMKIAELVEATRIEIRRIARMWTDARERYGQGGPFLFGEWSIADAYYTPVATRFRSYGVKLSDYGDHGPAGMLCDTLLEQPEFKEWERGAAEERAARAKDAT